MIGGWRQLERECYADDGDSCLDIDALLLVNCSDSCAFDIYLMRVLLLVVWVAVEGMTSLITSSCGTVVSRATFLFPPLDVPRPNLLDLLGIFFFGTMQASSIFASHSAASPSIS